VKSEGTGATVSFTTNAVDFTGTLTNQGSFNGAVTIDSNITSNVTNVIQNSATSRLVLGGAASTYANGVKINKGIVQLKTAAAAGAGAISLGEASSGVAATLTGSVDGTSIPNAISLATGAGALQVGSTANVTYTGGITGANAVELNNSTAGKTLTLSTGAINNTGALTLRPSNATATVRVDSAIGTNVTSVTVNGNVGGGKVILANANTHNGPTTMSGGILELANVNALQNSTLDTGIFGSDRTVTFTVAGSNTYNLGGLQGADALAIGSNTISVGANNASTTFSGAISGTDGGLTKVGNGTLTLSSATNGYTGATQVTDGTLIVNGNISTSITTVQTGATLGGTGTVGAVTVNSGAFHTPGNSPGIQLTGNYSNAGTLGIEINGTTVGTDYDQVNTTGTVSLSGLLSITMGYTPVANQLFFILANDDTDAIAGTFSNAAINGNTYTLGGQAFQISYFGNQTSPGVGTFTGGNDVVLMAVIPEPRAALLGGLGMLMLLRRRRP
jgi:autotransporter-associated beta strand protein